MLPRWADGAGRPGRLGEGSASGLALAKRWTRWRVTAGGRSDAAYQGVHAITRFGQFLAASKVPVQGLGQVDRDLLERYLAVLQHELAGKADHAKYIGSLNAFFAAIRRHGWDDTLPAMGRARRLDWLSRRTLGSTSGDRTCLPCAPSGPTCRNCPTRISKKWPEAVSLQQA